MIGVVSGLDHSLFRLMNEVWVSPSLDYLMPLLSRAGGMGVVWLLLLGVIAAFGKKTGRRIALAGLLALVIGFACSSLIKDITMRPRPFLVLPDIRLLVAAPHSYAFPSGHTTSSFAATTGVMFAARKTFGRVPVWSLGMLVLAVAISYSRIYVGVHWPTDVAAGVALGIFSGWSGWFGARWIMTLAARSPQSPRSRKREPESIGKYNMARKKER